MSPTEPAPVWQPSGGVTPDDVTAPVVRPSSPARSVGFETGSANAGEAAAEGTPHDPEAALPSAATPSYRPRTGPPLAKRPKGRIFVGCVLLGTTLLVGGQIWQTWFRYECYGVVGGRVIQLPAPWNGNVRSLHRREGEHVRQGDTLVSMDSPELTQALARVGDELRLAQATLAAQLSQLKWDSEFRSSERQKAAAEFYALWGDVMQEQARLQQLQQKLERLNALAGSGAVSREALDEARWDEIGQREKIVKLSYALGELKHRAQRDETNPALLGKLQPHLLRLETLAAELKRLRVEIERGYIRAPVDGQITQRLRLIGEYATAATPVIEILEAGSTEIVLYVPQSRADRFPIGHALRVIVDPSSSSVPCHVARLGVVMTAAPVSIQQHYRRDQKLVPVYLKPEGEHGAELAWRLGAKVKVPRFDRLAKQLEGPQ